MDYLKGKEKEKKKEKNRIKRTKKKEIQEKSHIVW